MDKLIAMCKLFKCSMDDLINDDVKDKEIIIKKDNQINNYVVGFINFFIESFNMVFSMKLKTLIKTCIELFIIALILFGGCGTLIHIFAELVFSYVGYSSIVYIGFIFLSCFLLLSFFVIFIEVYKNRYLNYYLKEKYKNNQIDDLDIKDVPKDEKKVEFKNEKIDFKNNEPKFIIRDRKESSFVITLLQILTICTKAFMIVFIAPWVIIAFICLILALVISIYLIFSNFIFFGIAIAIMGATIITELILEFIYKFLINKKINVKKYGIMFLVALIAIGIGSGLSIISLKNFEVKNIGVIDTYKKTFEYSDDLSFSTNNDIKFIIDNNVNDVQLEIHYNKELFDVKAELSQRNDDYKLINIDYRYLENYNAFTYMKMFINNIENNTIIVDDYYDDTDIVITSNEKNVENLIKNLSSLYRISVYEQKDGYLASIVDIVHKDDVCTLNNKGYYECILVSTDNFCEYNVDSYNNITPKDSKNCICERISSSAYSCFRKTNYTE